VGTGKPSFQERSAGSQLSENHCRGIKPDLKSVFLPLLQPLHHCSGSLVGLPAFLESILSIGQGVCPLESLGASLEYRHTEVT
jgi:hypothetical protein